MLRGTVPDPFQLEPLGIHGGGLARAVESLLTADGGLGPLSGDDLRALIDWLGDVRVGAPGDRISPSVPMVTESLLFRDRHLAKARDLMTAMDVSEGALYVLFALAALGHHDAPKMFAIENIDHALHPRLARALVRTLAETVRTRDKQILLTTHNPVVLDGLRLAVDDIRLFSVDRSSDGHTIVQRIPYCDALGAAEKLGVTLSQLWVQGVIGGVPNIW